MAVNSCARFVQRLCRNLIIPGLVLGLFPWLSGCSQLGLETPDFSKLGSKLSMRSQSPEKDEDASDEDDFDDELTTKVAVPMVGDYTTFTGLHRVVLEGVGLVVGLNGTGGDPPPSTYREALVDDMRRRNIREWKEIIRSPDTALVVVRAYLPPLISKGDKFDVDIRIPGDTGASSLNGGRLMETILSETALVPGQGVMKGHVVARAKGPIMLSPEEGDAENLAGVLKRGRVLGGGVSLIERDMALYVRSNFRTYRNITRLADKIGQRFYAYDEYGLREPLAKAQTDQRILLKVHPLYKHNYPRFLQVVQNIAFRETAVSRRVRLQRLEHELLQPEKAQRAALQLEAIGDEAISVLKSGLKSKHLECRFHAAHALSYLEESAGVDVLSEAAQKERAFRVFAYASLSILDDPQAHMALRDLMNVQVDADGKTTDSAETRYGAFRALWTLDKRDPFIAGEQIRKEFWLHPLNTTGDPMVHITNRKLAEIVLFGADQEFITPMAVRAGNHILVTSRPGSETITISRFMPYGEDKRKVVSKRIEDVIRVAAEFGASYPDIAQLLVQADRQGNMQGRFEIDALPQAGRVFYRNGNRARLGRTSLTPNMYQRPRGDDDSSSEEDFGDEPADGPSDDPAADAINDQLAAEGLSDVPTTLSMSEPSTVSASATGEVPASSDEPSSFSLSGQQDEPGTATLIDVRTPKATSEKTPSEKPPSKSSNVKKRLDPLGLFTLSKQKE
ncbi:MAG: flagellar basal body P-ring protein FlgI [Rhodopirellula sp.]|nr:flagellar basal body P-ring protein FlgI [Rhodopirellula sp.]